MHDTISTRQSIAQYSKQASTRIQTDMSNLTKEVLDSLETNQKIQIVT